MKKNFVPYNPALELKELGFDEPCFAKYFQQDGNTPFIQIGEREIEEAESAGDDVTFECDAPLYQQAFRWFREKYELVIDWNHSEHDNFGSYIGVCIKNVHLEDTVVGVYETYEEAELECLVKLIDIVKKQNLKN
jgi:hypothetical protein